MINREDWLFKASHVGGLEADGELTDGREWLPDNTAAGTPDQQ